MAVGGIELYELPKTFQALMPHRMLLKLESWEPRSCDLSPSKEGLIRKVQE